MDVTAVTLHPMAKEFLFNHFLILRKIFSDILGQIETDYASIALINSEDQVFFLSSKPSIELNLIEKNIWLFDGCYQSGFINQSLPKLWNELHHLDFDETIRKYKQIETGLITGISIPTQYDSYRAIFSFGFKKKNKSIHFK